MSESCDLYNLLGVDTSATQADIAKAYKKRAAAAHPDNQETGSAESFQAVRKAYDVLSDESRRSVYDAIGMVMGDDNIADAAVMLILELCGNIVESLPNCDLLLVLRVRIKDLSDQTRIAAEKYTNNAETVRKRWLGAETIKRAVAHNFEGRAKSLRDSIHVHNKALELLKGASFQMPQREPFAIGF